MFVFVAKTRLACLINDGPVVVWGVRGDRNVNSHLFALGLLEVTRRLTPTLTMTALHFDRIRQRGYHKELFPADITGLSVVATSKCCHLLILTDSTWKVRAGRLDNVEWTNEVDCGCMEL